MIALSCHHRDLHRGARFAAVQLCVMLTLAVALAVALAASALPARAQDGGPSTHWFEVEAINEALGEVPDGLDRETPQALLESFLALAGSDDPADVERAAHLLDLREVPRERRVQLGPILAGQLEAVLRRKVWLDWADVPDRPDGLSVQGGSDEPLAGEPRRSIRLALLDLDNRPVPIRVNRLKPENGDAVWLFSRQTVENVPALFETYGPTRFERAIPDPLKATVAFGLAIWELIAVPIIIALTVLIGLLAYRSVRAAGAKMPSELVRHIMDALALPVGIALAAAFGSFLTRSLFTFSAPVDAFLAPALTILLIAAALFAAVHTIDLVLDYFLADDVEELEKPENADRRRFQTNVSAARRIGLVIAFLAAAGLVMTQVGGFRSAGLSLLGSAGILTLILAYAGRTALSNIMASLQIAISKSAKIGDAVLWKGHWCYVEKINFTYVQLKSWDQRRLIVPVNEFVSETFENWTKRDPSLVKTVELRLNHQTDVQKLREAFEEWVEGRDDIASKGEAKVQVIGHDASGMELRFYATGTDPSTAWDMHCALREAMLKVASEMDPKGGHGALVLPAEREAKIIDKTGNADAWREAAE